MYVRIDSTTDRFGRPLYSRSRGLRLSPLAMALGIIALGVLLWTRPWTPRAAAAAAEEPLQRADLAPRLGEAIPERYHGAIVSTPPPGFTEPLVALTFDDGPHPDVTAPILDALSARGITATFFMLGLQAEKYPDLAKRVAAEGHILANHSYAHRVHMSQAEAVLELDRAEALIYRAAGDSPLLFRPPEGHTDTVLTQYARDEQFTIVQWSVDSEDWKHPPAKTIVANCMRDLEPGSIVILHDGGGGYPDTPKALPGLLDRIESEGYSFVTVPELLQAWDGHLSATGL
jgi:chitin deacetylase